MAASAAHAADLPVLEPPEITPVPIKAKSGWYLRGHIGMSNQKVDTLDYFAFDNPAVFEFVDKGDFDSAPFAGLGVGYRINKWARVDVTGEYRGKARFTALDRYDTDGDGTWDGTNDYDARKSEWLALANAYVDLGSWKGFSPFVGGGIGAARNTISDFRDVNTPNAGVAYASSESEWNFAWALHAGLAYEVTPNFTVDLAYRYVDLGDAETGPLTTYTGVTADEPMRFKDITSHDIMLGVRWDLGGHHKKDAYYEDAGYYEEEGYYEEPYPASEPIVRKH